MAVITIYYAGDMNGVEIDFSSPPPSLTIETDPQGYLYNRVTQDQLNALAVTDCYVELEALLEYAMDDDYETYWKAGSSLTFEVLDDGVVVEYGDYSDFSYAKLTAGRYYFTGATYGTVIANLFQGDSIPVPTVIALETASGIIPANKVSGAYDDEENGYAFQLFPLASASQAPRLLWGLLDTDPPTTDDVAGARFPRNIVSITVVTPSV